MNSLLSPQVDEFMIKSISGRVRPIRIPWIIKSTSGRVYYSVHKWMILSHKDTLKLSSPQVDEFIIKSTSG